jgi:phosphoribosyl 1,2-cyclic phosphodiesterase
MNNELKIKFWGARGSYPTPGAETVKYGGNTSCVEIRAGERLIILDAGTGIIPLGRELAKQKGGVELLLLFSHLVTFTHFRSRRNTGNREACIGAQSIY